MYKLLDYDITEYKQLENTLNELSKQGYNPTSERIGNRTALQSV